MTTRKFAYTLIGYRSNGTDSCRNCVMNRSDSDFFLECFIDTQEMADFWAKKQFDEELFATSKDYNRSVCSTEYTLLVNGRDAHSDPDENDLAEWDPVSGKPYADLARENVEDLVTVRLATLRKNHAQAVARKAEAGAAAERVRQDTARAVQEEKDRAEFARLRAKFGSNTP